MSASSRQLKTALLYANHAQSAGKSQAGTFTVQELADRAHMTNDSDATDTIALLLEQGWIEEPPVDVPVLLNSEMSRRYRLTQEGLGAGLMMR